MNNFQQRILELENEVSRLRILAERDALTGCLRREAFVSMIEERRRFGWLPQTMTLAVVDIDFFKKVNDTHGHLSGDEALKVVASVLKQSAPDGSLVCRMGGEEFVLLIPGAPHESAGPLDALRERIAATPIRTIQGDTIHLTASFGAAAWNTDQALLAATARADAALYRAKHAGRNRLMVDEEILRAAS